MPHGRVSPTLEYDRGDILYDKGSELWERSPDEYSYTQSTRIHRELARTLDKLVEKHGEFKKTDMDELAVFLIEEL